MKTFEQLEKLYAKEVSLAEKHKKNASDIKKQMETLKGKAVTEKINTLSLTGTEYDRLMKLLSAGKKTVMEAAEIVLGEDVLAENIVGGENFAITEKAEESEAS